MTTTLRRTGTAIFGMIFLALALSIFSVTLARADTVTPAAGTEGRGGVASAAPLTPLAGTAGRGGVASAAPLTPLAGTAGRGGVAFAPFAAGASSSATAGWVAGILIVAALVGGLAVYWASTRRQRAGRGASVTSIARDGAVSADSVSQQWERRAA